MPGGTSKSLFVKVSKSLFVKVNTHPRVFTQEHHPLPKVEYVLVDAELESFVSWESTVKEPAGDLHRKRVVVEMVFLSWLNKVFDDQQNSVLKLATSKIFQLQFWAFWPRWRSKEGYGCSYTVFGDTTENKMAQFLGQSVGIEGYSSEFFNVKKTAQADCVIFAGCFSALLVSDRDMKLIMPRNVTALKQGGGSVKDMNVNGLRKGSRMMKIAQFLYAFESDRLESGGGKMKIEQARCVIALEAIKRSVDEIGGKLIDIGIITSILIVQLIGIDHGSLVGVVATDLESETKIVVAAGHEVQLIGTNIDLDNHFDVKSKPPDDSKAIEELQQSCLSGIEWRFRFKSWDLGDFEAVVEVDWMCCLELLILLKSAVVEGQDKPIVVLGKIDQEVATEACEFQGVASKACEFPTKLEGDVDVELKMHETAKISQDLDGFQSGVVKEYARKFEELKLIILQDLKGHGVNVEAAFQIEKLLRFENKMTFLARACICDNDMFKSEKDSDPEPLYVLCLPDEDTMKRLEEITSGPSVLVGIPCVRGKGVELICSRPDLHLYAYVLAVVALPIPIRLQFCVLETELVVLDTEEVPDGRGKRAAASPEMSVTGLKSLAGISSVVLSLGTESSIAVDASLAYANVCKNHREYYRDLLREFCSSLAALTRVDPWLYVKSWPPFKRLVVQGLIKDQVAIMYLWSKLLKLTILEPANTYTRPVKSVAVRKQGDGIRKKVVSLEYVTARIADAEVEGRAGLSFHIGCCLLHLFFRTTVTRTLIEQICFGWPGQLWLLGLWLGSSGDTIWCERYPSSSY